MANAAAGKVTVRQGLGAGRFGPARSYAVGADPIGIAAGDLNGDGRPDIVTVNQASDTVSVLLNEGHGRFATAQSYAAGAGPSSIAIGDLNGDGKLDIVAADRDGHDVSILLGNGNGTFEAPITFPAGLGPVSVALGDLTGNGKLDIIVGDSYSGMISVLLNQGDDRFGPPIPFAVPVSYNLASQGVAVGDFNGDGKLDIAVSSSYQDEIAVYAGNGDGTFQFDAYTRSESVPRGWRPAPSSARAGPTWPLPMHRVARSPSSRVTGCPRRRPDGGHPPIPTVPGIGVPGRAAIRLDGRCDGLAPARCRPSGSAPGGERNRRPPPARRRTDAGPEPTVGRAGDAPAGPPIGKSGPTWPLLTSTMLPVIPAPR